MGRLERLSDLPGNRQRFIDGNGSAREPLVEALAVHEFKHEELGTARLFEPMDRADVWMIE